MRPGVVDHARPETVWFGADPSFWYPLERDAHRFLPEAVVWRYRPGLLTYTVEKLAVPGEVLPHGITIEFWRIPEYETYGLAPEDYPRVHTDSLSPRRHAFCAGDLCICASGARRYGVTLHSGPLCLWYPHDPSARRWTHDMGLRVLIEMIRRHLLAELEWRRTGRWILEEAAHGFPVPMSA